MMVVFNSEEELLAELEKDKEQAALDAAGYDVRLGGFKAAKGT